MSEVTRLLAAIDAGETYAAEELLPLVYEELRRLAAAQMTRERPGQTLNATALVHEAYLRLVGDQRFAGRGHFFAAAAEAMRRILIERARRRGRLKHGGGRERGSLEDHEPAAAAGVEPIDLIALNEALDRLEAASARRAQVVKLRYFAGLSMPEVAELVGVCLSTAEADWAYAKAWLKRDMSGG